MLLEGEIDVVTFASPRPCAVSSRFSALSGRRPLEEHGRGGHRTGDGEARRDSWVIPVTVQAVNLHRSCARRCHRGRLRCREGREHRTEPRRIEASRVQIWQDSHMLEQTTSRLSLARRPGVFAGPTPSVASSARRA